MLRAVIGSLSLAMGVHLAGAAPIDGTFRYQGRLDASGAPFTGQADFLVSLHDAEVGGGVVAGPVLVSGVQVSDGIFDLELDFGPEAFDGQQRWLGISVEAPSGGGGFTLLSPRHPILGTPYAIQTRGLYIDPSLRVGIGTTVPGELFEVVGDTELAAIFGNNTRPVSSAFGVYGRSASDVGRGVYGYATNAVGFNFGVYGRSDSTDGKGVFGSSNAGSGMTYGVYGQAISQDGTGVYGLHNTTAGTGPGAVGETMSTWFGATGVLGLVSGATNGSTSAGVLGENRGDRDDSYGVHGKHLGDGIGVFGTTTGPASDGTGVMGQSTSGIGVYGRTLSASAITYGVLGQTSSIFGYGVYGEALASGGSPSGVYGTTTSPSGRGVTGWASANTGAGIGVFGEASSDDGWGGYFLGRGYFSDRLGVGTTVPETPLHILGGSDATALGGGFLMAGDFNSTNIVIDNNEILARDWIGPGTLFLQRNGGHVEIGDNNAFNGPRLIVEGYSDTDTFAEIAEFNLTTEDPGDTFSHNLIHFNFNGVKRGQINIAAAGVDYFGFTGAHYAMSSEPLEPGMLVVMTGRNEPMSDAPGAEPIYGVEIASVPNDPRTLGAHRGEISGELAPVTDLIASVGNGAMWVTDDGRRDLEPGDYLISSGVSGCAMLDDTARFPVGHIVAQIGERVDWSAIRPDPGGRRRALVTVQFERFDRHGAAEVTALELRRLRDENAELEAELLARQGEIETLAAEILALRRLVDPRPERGEDER